MCMYSLRRLIKKHGFIRTLRLWVTPRDSFQVSLFVTPFSDSEGPALCSRQCTWVLKTWCAQHGRLSAHPSRRTNPPAPKMTLFVFRASPWICKCGPGHCLLAGTGALPPFPPGRHCCAFVMQQANLGEWEARCFSESQLAVVKG